jgi:hypothetical protein
MIKLFLLQGFRYSGSDNEHKKLPKQVEICAFVKQVTRCWVWNGGWIYWNRIARRYKYL